MSEYYDNQNIYCNQCNKLRYMGYTDKIDSELCTCADQDNIPMVIKYKTFTTELTDEELLYASEEDWAFYNKIIEGLPTMAGKNGDGKDKFGEYIPYHSGPHILRHFIETIKIVKPKRIFEIGFNMGHSARMWLELCPADVCSCDVSRKDETIEAAAFLDKTYNKAYTKHGDRFTFNWREEIGISKLNPYPEKYFDLAFIDGAHDQMSIFGDICMCKDMKIPYLLFDDWYPRYGETQKAVAKFAELELVKDMNNLRLYKVNYELGK